MEHRKTHRDWKLRRPSGSHGNLADQPKSAVVHDGLYHHQAVSMVRSFYDLSALQWDNRDMKFSRFEGKVILVVNTATAHVQSSRHFIQVRKVNITNTTMPNVLCRGMCFEMGRGGVSEARGSLYSQLIEQFRQSRMH